MPAQGQPTKRGRKRRAGAWGEAALLPLGRLRTGQAPPHQRQRVRKRAQQQQQGTTRCPPRPGSVRRRGAA